MKVSGHTSTGKKHGLGRGIVCICWKG